MSKLKVNIRPHDLTGIQVQIIDLVGFLDAHTVPQLETMLNALFKAKHYNLILNMVELQYISSAGLGLLLGIVDEIKTNNGDLFIVNLSSNVYKVFDILGFTKVFHIFAEEIEALNKFEEKESKSNYKNENGKKNRN